MLKAALLYYKNISRELKEYGFVINPYDPCVAKNGQTKDNSSWSGTSAI